LTFLAKLEAASQMPRVAYLVACRRWAYLHVLVIGFISRQINKMMMTMICQASGLQIRSNTFLSLLAACLLINDAVKDFLQFI